MRIVSLKVVFQRPATKRARKDVVRKRSIDGPYQNREMEIETDITAGAGSDANTQVRRVVYEALKHAHKGEKVFYVVAEFEQPGEDNYFKTIVPRSEIPIQLRRV